MATRVQIIAEIARYMTKWEDEYSAWFVGVAADPRQALFSDHGVREEEDGWIYRDCLSASLAHRIEEHFVRRNADGGDGGTTRFVYAYRKAPHTQP